MLAKRDKLFISPNARSLANVPFCMLSICGWSTEHEFECLSVYFCGFRFKFHSIINELERRAHTCTPNQRAKYKLNGKETQCSALVETRSKHSETKNGMQRRATQRKYTTTKTMNSIGFQCHTIDIRKRWKRITQRVGFARTKRMFLLGRSNQLLFTATFTNMHL